MRHRRPRIDWRGVLIGIAAAALVLTAAPVVADVGDSVLIGRFNTGDRKTSLVGAVDGDSVLKIANTATKGTGLTIQVAKGQAPLVVNRSKRVKKLNADQLDGLSSEDLAPRVLTKVYTDYGLSLAGMPMVCETPTYTAADDGLAVISTTVSLQGPVAGPVDWGTKAVYTTDGGTYSNATPDLWLRTTSNSGDFSSLSSVAAVELTAGETYAFAIRIGQFAGEATTGDYICSTVVEISPRVADTGIIGQSVPD